MRPISGKSFTTDFDPLAWFSVTGSKAPASGALPGRRLGVPTSAPEGLGAIAGDLDAPAPVVARQAGLAFELREETPGLRQRFPHGRQEGPPRPAVLQDQPVEARDGAGRSGRTRPGTSWARGRSARRYRGKVLPAPWAARARIGGPGRRRQRHSPPRRPPTAGRRRGDRYSRAGSRGGAGSRSRPPGRSGYPESPPGRRGEARRPPDPGGWIPRPGRGAADGHPRPRRTRPPPMPSPKAQWKA